MSDKNASTELSAWATRRYQRLQAARGKTPCDWVIRNARVLDVFTLRWVRADVAAFDGVIVGLDPGLKAHREISGQDRWVVPGFIDAHVHVESSMLLPPAFAQAVLPCGTTTIICDPHELANVEGVAALKYFLDGATQLPLDMRVMLSSCVPATQFETNGAGALSVRELAPFISHPKSLGLAEVMNVPGVLEGEGSIWDKLEAFSGSVIDGHCPGLSGLDLNAYATAGISSCHESTTLQEAQDKLTRGLAVWIRQGSVAQDLPALVELLTVGSSARVGFCTDDRNPLDIATDGHIDALIRGAIALGAPELAVYRSASWSVASHYGLRGVGAIAPGYRADCVLLGDPKSCAVEAVSVAGSWVGELDFGQATDGAYINSVQASRPQPQDLQGPQGRVHVIGVRERQIITDHRIENHDAPGIAHLSVLERHGHGRPPATAYVHGFGESFHGAIASSVGHDSHNLIAVGSDTCDMAAAFGALIDCGGGFCVVDQGAVKALLPLPRGGLMSLQSAGAVESQLRLLRTQCKAQGCVLTEPFLQLAFLSLPVIPALKLTDHGLFDYQAFGIIDVRAG